MTLLFEKFDEDHSGELNFNEVQELFRANNIKIEEPELRKMFEIIHEASSKKDVKSKF